jgi:hypothetical protein
LVLLQKKTRIFGKNNTSESLDKSYLRTWGFNLGPAET